MKPALLAALLSWAQIQAQSTDGRLSGVIMDSSGAAIPGATVTARDRDKGTELRVKSNAQGDYVLYPLPPGKYTVAVEAPGFRSESVNGAEVNVAAVLSRDIRLQVGDVQQALTITATSDRLLTESQSVESTIFREQIDTLPLNGRDFNQLVLLSAGAVENAYPGGDFGSVSSNGNRAFSNDYLIDGTPNDNVFTAGAALPLSVDVIQEFKVISGVAPAEFGQAGTQITMVTRSGANRVHGSAFEYHRGTLWQAGNPFAPGAPQPFDRNQFGGSIGGPIRRDRTFFFFNYEGNRQSQSTTVVATSPLDAFWTGDFSSLAARNIVVKDPLQASKTPFPGALIPASRLNPVALALRPYWPSPTTPGLANNAIKTLNSTNPVDQFTTRVDQAMPRQQNLSLRYTQAHSDNTQPSITGSAAATSTTQANINASLGWTAPLSATTISEFRIGFTRQTITVQYEAGALPTAASIGMLGIGPADGVRQPIPKIVFTGNDAFTALNYGPTSTYGLAATNQKNDTLTLSESLTLVRGAHTFKTGYEYRHLRLPTLLQPGSYGTINFNSGANTSSGYSFADMLLGFPATTQQLPPMAPVVLLEQDMAAFAQDDWRISRRLTLRMGVRYELLLNPYEEKNRFALFDAATGAIVVASNNGVLPAGQYSPAVVAKLGAPNGGFTFPLISDKQAGFNPRSLIDQRYKYFGPRFGFAYSIDPSGAFLARGGYGIFHTRYPFQYLEQSTAMNPPFAGTFNYTQSVAGGTPAIVLQNPFSGSGSATIAPSGLTRDFALPDNQQWDLTLERYLGGGTTMSLGYVGNKGSHLYRSINANGAYLNAAGVLVRNYSSIYGTNAINLRRTDANSIYNAMQTELRRRLRNGLMFQGNWTWAKGLDNTGNTVNGAALDIQNLGRDRADSTGVRRHMFKVNATYDLPGRGRVLGGWRVAGIWLFATGLPMTPSFTASGGLANNRPDVVYGVAANLPAGERNASRWFNPAAFAPVPAVDPITGLPRFGNAGRNILIGPRANSADSSLSKTFPLIHERYRLTFRLEFFNMFNHPNYGLPDTNISDVNTVATINTLIKPMREAQFALRLDF